MLSPSYLDHVADELVALYDDLQNSIIEDMIRRVIRMGEVSETTNYQMERLRETGALYNHVIRTIARATKQSEEVLREVFKDAAEESLAFDDALYRKAGFAPTPIGQSRALRQILEAGLFKTKGKLKNLTLTTAAATQRTFIQMTDLAYMQVSTGAMSYTQAIRDATKRIAKRGLDVIAYDTGHRERIDVAVRRAVLTGVNQTAAELQLERMNELGCDLLETSAHMGARPSHSDWQGQVFSRSGRHPRYPDFVSSTGYGNVDGLCGVNCRHSFFPFIEGVSEPNYTAKQLKAMEEREVEYNGEKMTYYEATQKQRRLERSIRATKREWTAASAAKSATDESGLKNAMQDDVRRISRTLNAQQNKMADFLDQTGLNRQRDREQVVGFGRSEAQRARQTGRG